MNEFGEAKIVDVADVGVERLVVHDEHRHDPSLAFALSRLAEHPETPTPVGVFRDVERPVYEVEVQRQLAAAVERVGPGRPRRAARGSAPTWTVGVARPRGQPFSPELRNTMPVRGLGEKNVVFCGMRTPVDGGGPGPRHRDR